MLGTNPRSRLAECNVVLALSSVFSTASYILDGFCLQFGLLNRLEADLETNIV